MKLPEQIHQITINFKIEIGVYPPNGFLKSDEANLGNGDFFGLYWEFWKEHQEPIICEMFHDDRIRFSKKYHQLYFIKLDY